MKKIGIFYGSSGGTTEAVAERIAEKLGVSPSDVHNVANTKAETAAIYEILLLGSSTWGAGDLQDDWFDFLPQLKAVDLKDKTVAIFGCGDSSSFSDTFCDAIGTIYNELQDSGCTFAGSVDAAGYLYDDSTAVVDGRFVGLALDELNEEEKTEERLTAWTEQLRKELAI